MIRRTLSLLAALALALSLCSCREEQALDTDEFLGDEFMQTDEPVREEPTVLQVDTLALPYLSAQSFDPVTCIDGVQQTVGSLLYEGLFTLDEHFAPQNVLCSHYIYDEESLTYTFTLRTDVCFSDGSPLTAADVLATYRRAESSARYGARFAAVSAMKAVDEQKLTITLREANASFCALLDIPIVKAGTENDTVPLGTGPYVYAKEQDGAALLVNHEWRGTPPLTRIRLISAKDNSTSLSLFSSRSVHFLYLDPTEAGVHSAVGAAALQNVPTTTMQFLGFNTRRALLADASVRRAMSGVLDRTSIASALLSGHALPAQFPVSPASALYPQSMEYRTKASVYTAALEAAGVHAGAPRQLTLLVNEENSFKSSIAESLCTQLSTDALTVVLRSLPWEDYLAALQRGDFDLYLGEVRLTADWNTAALLDADGALNYGSFTSETLPASLSAFLAAGSSAYFDAFAAETPFAPLLFKSNAVLIPAGLIDGMTPTVSAPFAGVEHWSFHLSGEA